MDKVINTIIEEAIQPFVIFIFAVAIMVFIYGVVEMIYSADNEEKRKKGKQHLAWGLIGMALMISSQGVLMIIQNFVDSF
ncbi:MAG: hypothetical protein PHC85_01540 [Candidatus Pacebacteria bacterium]|nr:hypothetical protein [Candidatus Paceibacterota bacterium]